MEGITAPGVCFGKPACVCVCAHAHVSLKELVGVRERKIEKPPRDPTVDDTLACSNSLRLSTVHTAYCFL